MGADMTGELDSCLRVATIVTVAMMASVGVYVILAAVLVDRGEIPFQPAGMLPSLLPAALVAAAVLLVVAAQALYRMQLARLRGLAGAAGALAEYRRTHLIGLALSESAAIFGLVLTLLWGALLWCYALAALALVSMAALWPNRSRLQELLTPAGRAPIEPH